MQTGLTLTLPLGVVAIVLAFTLLTRWTPLRAGQAALVVTLLALAIYLPYALIDWPGADVAAIHVAVFSVAAYALGMVTSQRQGRAPGASGKWFHWGPALIVAFFSVVVVVDAVFVTISMEGVPAPFQGAMLPKSTASGSAQTLFPGVVHDHLYQKEQAYNAHLEQMQRQRQRGWQVRKGWLTDHPRVGEPAELQLVVSDAQGKGIGEATVTGRFIRPSDSRLDQTFTMKEVREGVYRARLALPEPGIWHLQVDIRRGDTLHEVRGSTRIYDSALALR